MEKINQFLKENNLTALKRSYMDACSKKEFKEFVEQLPIEEDILIKYTSKLEEASIEFDHCKRCKKLTECKNQIKGYCYYPEKENNNLNFSYIMCKKMKIVEHICTKNRIEALT